MRAASEILNRCLRQELEPENTALVESINDECHSGDRATEKLDDR